MEENNTIERKANEQIVKCRRSSGRPRGLEAFFCSGGNLQASNPGTPVDDDETQMYIIIAIFYTIFTHEDVFDM